MPSARLKWHTSTLGTLRGKFQKIFGKATHIGMPPIPREGGREGVTEVTVLQHRFLQILKWRNHTPKSFCRVQRKPPNLQPFGMVNVTKNAYLCRRKPIETAARE